MINDLQEKLRKYLNSEERINHSVRVADLAVELAKIYKIDEQKAYVAGIFHDMAKEITFEKAIQITREYNYSLSESELLNNKLLHAPIGALLAQYELKIDDKDIIMAIRWHTTGKAEMSILEKIIYLADISEPGRKHPELMQIQELAKQNINKAMLLAVKFSLKKLIESERSIDPKSVECYNYFTKN
ncbi:MAG: bis(5'-nucleosyl)-tetraphosphatase (symmetrical) YqeK [Candidatus Margulisbacteria bacterium]|nr:bis(5'-nucleosyl)-tetraphosphatase (symmetrical) YqeK [Candidatus Margulisiibacteriota bacterium]